MGSDLNFIFSGKTPCFWFYDLNAKGSQRRLHLLWCRFETGVASGLIPRTISWRIFAGVCRYTFEAGDLRLLLSQLPCSWWLFLYFSRYFLDLWKTTLWQKYFAKTIKNLCDQGDWWPVHAPGADSDVVSFHHPIAGQTCQTFSGIVSDE